MSTPEIPAELLDAFECAHDNHPESHPDIATEVWPVLYATALRHAADMIDDSHTDGARGWETSTDRLRAMADEAVS